MSIREKIESVAVEHGWTLAVPTQMYAVYIRDELIWSIELGNETGPPWAQLAVGTRRWVVRAPGPVLNTGLKWLADPYTVVNWLTPTSSNGIEWSPLAVDATVVRVSAYATELDDLLQRGLIDESFAGVIERLREIVREAQP
ncbi:hypothetical protein [Nocardia sp. NPDC049149]|uniref:hypothetical protein n=1 Tax=Nocardia sp. NPDC049149 TaxID=3364315 RepID=UPI003712DDFA